MTKADGAPKNRRRSPRAHARIRILFTRTGTTIGIEAESDDISLDGVFVRTERRPPEVGTKLGLLLKFDENDQELMLSGEVARVREGTGPDSPGMGIRFINMDADTRKALIRALEGTGAYEAIRHIDDGG